MFCHFIFCGFLFFKQIRTSEGNVNLSQETGKIATGAIVKLYFVGSNSVKPVNNGHSTPSESMNVQKSFKKGFGSNVLSAIEIACSFKAIIEYGLVMKVVN